MKWYSKKLDNWTVGVFWCAAVVVSLFITTTLGHGCRLSPTDSPPAQETSVTNGSTELAEVSVRRWSQGIVLTFPITPTEETVARLKLAKAKERSQRVWVIENYNRFDQLQNVALDYSLHEGAIGIGTKP